jgi:7-cyano-7-deazaguanine tRNA-ribosyltransferase
MSSASYLFWLGESKQSPIKFDRSSDFVMDSVANYYEDEEPKLRYKPGKLFLDNGAYTTSRTGRRLKIDRVIEVQEKLNPTMTIPLDYPFSSWMSERQMEKRWNSTTRNIKYWQSSTSLSGLVPALHSWSYSSLLKNLRWLEKNADSDYLALGSLVGPEFVKSTSFFGDRQPNTQLIDMISLAIESVQETTDFNVHLMGFGSSPLMMHLGYYLGVDSTDSSGFRRKAAFGMIVLPGTAERYVGDRAAKFGGTKGMSEREIEVLNNCECQSCKINQDLLWSDFKSRAIHNEYVMKNERKKAEYLASLGEDHYVAYLDEIFAKSSLNFLWQHTKLRRKYNRISNVLFPKR